METQKDIVDEHSGTIREHDRLLATLLERLDGVRGDLARIEGAMKVLNAEVTATQAQSAVAVRDSARLEKRLDEYISRRFDIGKLILAAILGELITLVSALAIRVVERWFATNSPASANQRP